MMFKDNPNLQQAILKTVTVTTHISINADDQTKCSSACCFLDSSEAFNPYCKLFGEWLPAGLYNRTPTCLQSTNIRNITIPVIEVDEEFSRSMDAWSSKLMNERMKNSKVLYPSRLIKKEKK